MQAQHDVTSPLRLELYGRLPLWLAGRWRHERRGHALDASELLERGGDLGSHPD